MSYTITPREKLVQIGRALGIKDFSKMQGTERNVYDCLPQIDLPGVQYNFFQNVSSRDFPDTNVTDNKFQVNEALCIEGLIFFVVTDEGIMQPLPELMYVCDVRIGNRTVLKDMPVGPLSITNSGVAKGQQGNYVFMLEKPGIVIPPQVEYVVQLRQEQGVSAIETPTIGCIAFGHGALLNFGISL